MSSNPKSSKTFHNLIKHSSSPGAFNSPYISAHSNKNKTNLHQHSNSTKQQSNLINEIHKKNRWFSPQKELQQTTSHKQWKAFQNVNTKQNTDHSIDLKSQSIDFGNINTINTLQENGNEFVNILNEESIQELDTEENMNSIDEIKATPTKNQIEIVDINWMNDSNNLSTLIKENEPLLRQFLQVARKGDKELFLDSLARIISLSNAWINYQDEQGLTALHYATDEGNLKIVEILIKSSMNVNIQSSIKRTALHVSCFRGYFDISKQLIENGAVINIQDNEKNTPIHLCAMNNHIELWKYLWERCPQADTKNIYNKAPIDLTKHKDTIKLLQDYLLWNESKYHKIKIHNANNNIAINMLSDIKSKSHAKANCSSVKGILFNKKRNNMNYLSTSNNGNSNYYSMNNKVENNSNVNNTNNNWNINISVNMCNVVNWARQKSKKILNSDLSSKSSGISNHKLWSPKLQKKSVSKQWLKRENTNISETRNNNCLAHSTGARINVNPFVSPNKNSKKNYYLTNTSNNNIFQKAKSKPLFITNKPKQHIENTRPATSINKKAKNKIKTNIQIPSTFTQKQAETAIPQTNTNTKKIENVQINLDESDSNDTSINNTNANINKSNPEEHEEIEEKISPEEFICHTKWGKGSFGEVYLVEKKNTNIFYAMKVLNKNLIMNQNIVKYAMTERNVLSVTSHPFIVKLNYAFQTKEKWFLILDYCPGGDLAAHWEIEKRFPEQRAKIYWCEIALAWGDLHKHGIIFRDWKPDNVVWDKQGHSCWTDFGWSKEGVYDGNITKSFCGSIAYLAPEMLKRNGHGKAVDWYWWGVLFYEMWVGIPPFFYRW